MNSVVRKTDRSDMTSPVYRGRKALNQTKYNTITPTLVVDKSNKVLEIHCACAY